MCYPAGECRTASGSDVLLDKLHIEGFLEPVWVWMSAAMTGLRVSRRWRAAASCAPPAPMAGSRAEAGASWREGP